MIIRGISRLVLKEGATPGWDVIDLTRPDKTASQPGYVYVGLIDAAAPPAPYWVSCEIIRGILAAVLGCTETVDGYQVGLSLTLAAPTAWAFTPTSNYTQVVPPGTYYVFARSVRGNAVSAWVRYSDSITCGGIYDDLREDVLQVPFPGSHLIRFAGRDDPELVETFTGPLRLEGEPSVLYMDEFAKWNNALPTASHVVVRAVEPWNQNSIAIFTSGGVRITGSTVGIVGDGALALPVISTPESGITDYCLVYASSDGGLFRMASDDTEVGIMQFLGVSDTAPANPSEGWVYYNSSDSKVYIYADGGWKALT